jgi:hypothetical protein
VSAATVHQLPPVFDLAAVIREEIAAARDAEPAGVVLDVALVAERVARRIPADQVDSVLQSLLRSRVSNLAWGGQRNAAAAVTPAASPRPGSSKVDAIRADWRARLAAYEFEGAFAVPTNLLTATRTDLAACAERHAHHVAFLTQVANALDSHRAERVRDLPVPVQQRIAEKIPRRAS